VAGFMELAKKRRPFGVALLAGHVQAARRSDARRSRTSAAWKYAMRFLRIRLSSTKERVSQAGSGLN
jgi:hypothetical protein